MKKYLIYWIIGFFSIVIFHINRYIEIITHPSVLVQDVLLLTLLITPAGLLFFARKIEKKWSKRIAISITFLTICLSSLRLIFLIIGMSTENYSENIDHSFNKINTVTLQSSEIKVYLTNCGATCAYGIVIRQEMNLFFDFTLTKQLLTEYRCDEATVEKKEKNIQLQACTQQALVEPNRWVYF